MKYVAIVECISSGQLYIPDIIAMGCKPLIVYPRNVFNQHIAEYREMIAKNIGDRAEYIDEGPDYSEFLEKMKGYDLQAVVPGSDFGVALADRLSKDLGLPGNDPETTMLRTTKKGMFDALSKKGLRRIETSVVNSEEEVRAFMDKYQISRCVLKYSFGAGTVGLKICNSPEEAVEHFRTMVENENTTQVQGNSILIQEYVGGTEYIVNTASFNGRHILTDIWFYKKDQNADGTLMYDAAELVKTLRPGHMDLIEYAFDVLDAVGLEFGPCHTEIKMDEKGPVLIETNARPMGAAMTAAYLDEALGHHITDIGLAAYLDPDLFDKLKRIPYAPRKYAMMKFIAIPRDMKGDFAPALFMADRVNSYREVTFFGKPGVQEYHRTVDLDTSPIAIKMINEDYGELMKDYNFIRLLETNYFDLLYTTDPNIHGVEQTSDMKALVQSFDPMRKMCVVTDSGSLAYQYGEVRPADRREVFDAVIFAACGPGTLRDRYGAMFTSIRQVKRGGMYAFLPESYAELPHGRVAAEAMLNMMDFTILASTSDIKNIVRGQRN